MSVREPAAGASFSGLIIQASRRFGPLRVAITSAVALLSIFQIYLAGYTGEIPSALHVFIDAYVQSTMISKLAIASAYAGFTSRFLVAATRTVLVSVADSARVKKRSQEHPKQSRQQRLLGIAAGRLQRRIRRSRIAVEASIFTVGFSALLFDYVIAIMYVIVLLIAAPTIYFCFYLLTYRWPRQRMKGVSLYRKFTILCRRPEGPSEQRWYYFLLVFGVTYVLFAAYVAGQLTFVTAMGRETTIRTDEGEIRAALAFANANGVIIIENPDRLSALAQLVLPESMSMSAMFLPYGSFRRVEGL